MRNLRKRHSWPPLRKPSAFYVDEKIDQDPFAYFISPSEEGDEFITNPPEDLSAGISDSTRRTRSASPDIRKARALRFASVVASSPTATLKKWIERMELRCFHRSPRKSPAATMQRPMPSPETPQILEMTPVNTSPSRGRREYRQGSTHRVGRKPRPRLWKAPSGDIWPVVEEREEVGLGILV